MKRRILPDFENETIQAYNFDVIIVGTGVAGLYAALNLDEDLEVAVVTKANIDESNSYLAQGGIAAVMTADDNYHNHVEDTLVAGAGLCNREAVEVLCEEGPSDIRKLIEMQVPFDVNEDGDLQITREGGHHHRRIVHCGGDCKSTERKEIYEGIETCAAANLLYGGTGKCSFGCLGYGDCKAVCKSDAICIEDGIAHVSTSLCIGCGMCVRACPKHLISLVPDVIQTIVFCSNREKGATVRKECVSGCIACKKCEKLCPEQAIVVRDNLAEVDAEKCTGCGICADNCPVGCIKVGSFLGAHK